MRHHATPTGYGRIQITLHWLSALGLAVLLPLGLWMTGLDYYDPWYRAAPDLHRALGVLLGLLMVLRLAWRWSRPQPKPAHAGITARRITRSVHALLYLVPLLLVLSGYLVSTADGRAVSVLGWFDVPATLHGIDGQADIAGNLHYALALLLIGLITLHVAAALYHHWIKRDATLRRMFTLCPDRSPPEDSR